MPTRQEIRAEIAQVTPESFSSMVIIDKANMKPADANRLILNALISYHALLLIDEIKAQINAGTTNISTKTFLDIMRDSWKANADLRTELEQTICVAIANDLKSYTTLGRNQAIHLIKEKVISCLHTKLKP